MLFGHVKCLDVHDNVKCQKSVRRTHQTLYCLYCHDIETVEHMIFICTEAQHIWKRIVTIMNINIKWKHVAIGYTHINRNTLLRNTLFSFIAFCI